MNRTSALTLLLLAVRAFAQDIPPAQAGYVYPEPVSVAPGQIVMLSFRGVSPRIRPVYAERPATQVDGLWAMVRQGEADPVLVELFGFRQEGCHVMEVNCDPLTSVTAAIPFGLNPDAPAVLLVNDNGRELRAIPLRIVHDRIHILNACDRTGILLPLGTGWQGACEAMVTDASGRLVSRENPARPGQTLTAWAYGLGAGNPGIELFFEFRANASGRRRVGETGVRPDYVGLQAPWGLYQINFVVPAVPSGVAPCDGRAVHANLTVTFAGATSVDGVALCAAG